MQPKKEIFSILPNAQQAGVQKKKQDIFTILPNTSNNKNENQSEPVQRATFGKAPRFQKTFTSKTGLTGIILGDHKPIKFNLNYIPNLEEKRMFARYVNAIIRAYPLREYVYIGIGASCDLVLEYIQLKYRDATLAKIPISKVKTMPTEDREWSEIELGRLQNYVQKAIGLSVIRDSRKKLVMDVTSGGHSLRMVGNAVEALMLVGSVDRLSLNDYVTNSTTLYVPKANYAGAHAPLDADNMKSRRLTIEESVKKIVKKGSMWYFEREFVDESPANSDSDSLSSSSSSYSPGWFRKEQDSSDSDSSDEDPMIELFYPTEYDRFIVEELGAASLIGKRLENEEYKNLGRIYDKIAMSEVMQGKYRSAQHAYDEAGHRRIRSYAESLL
ncbi:hypothetical protein [Candidatus Uabimicrobium amorphum]|uniref:Uncharacterized protein n=1 Tax=Uabimicrobium amorphum TaxID=2596890 RepID=A0A5S9F6H3_UABAM|nr:hypothetical protein [Candidatus Uabimicrobium amorphum]BBM86679.1 hypothetical protein UABAM_05065 [Candidatus Uabimicrobium amorphum]